MKKLTMQDLQKNYTQKPSGIWVVDNLLRTNRKRISLLCGSPHAGKSTLARQLAVAVAHGEPFLGRATFKSKVVYWQSEETEEDAREDFHKSGMSFDDTDFCLLHAEGAENNLTALNECLNDDPDIRIVILETLDDFLQVDDLNKNNDVRKVFEKFYADVIEAHTNRCVFVALHHFKKSDEQKGSSLTKILGATVISGKTDAKILMRGCGDNDPRRVISIQTRKGIPIEPTYLIFEEATQTSTLGATVAEEKKETKRAGVAMNESDRRQKCLAVVAENPLIPKTKACELVGGFKEAAFVMFDRLISEGAIKTQKGGKTGTAILMYIDGTEPRTPSRDELAAHLEENRHRLTRAQENAAQYPNNSHWQDEISRLTKITEGSAKPSRLCQSCEINKAKGTEFNTEWGERFCSATCAQQGGIPCTA